MKRLTLIVSLLTFTLTFGQTSTDSIAINKVFGAYKFYQGEKRLNMNQLVRTMKPNELAYKKIKSAQSYNTLATISGMSGGLMLGWPLGIAFGGGNPDWILAGVGALLVIVSIPISQQSVFETKLAVETYNSGLKTSSFWDKKELNFSMTGNGIGLTLKF